MTAEEQNQITEAFMKDFQDLLRKYDACFDVYYESYGSDYDSYGSDFMADIGFHAIYDEKGNELRPYINLQLPSHIDSREEQ